MGDTDKYLYNTAPGCHESGKSSSNWQNLWFLNPPLRVASQEYCMCYAHAAEQKTTS